MSVVTISDEHAPDEGSQHGIASACSPQAFTDAWQCLSCLPEMGRLAALLIQSTPLRLLRLLAEHRLWMSLLGRWAARRFADATVTAAAAARSLARPGSGLRHLLEKVCGLWVNTICQSPCEQDVSPPENKTPVSPSGQLTGSRLARATYWPERRQTRAVLLRTNSRQYAASLTLRPGSFSQRTD